MTVTTEDNLTATTGGVQPPGVVEEVRDTAPSEGDRGVEPVEDLVEEDLLVEDVSIDGMCGVY